MTLHLALMLALILSGADLALVIALSGAMPLFSGVLSAIVVRRSASRLHGSCAAASRESARWRSCPPRAGCSWWSFRTSRCTRPAAWCSAPTGRRPPSASSRARSARTTSSTRSAGRSPCRSCRPRRAMRRRATHAAPRELAVRGTRYTLALVVPLCVTLMTLAEPILEVWLGDRYGDGGAALAILVSYWLLYGGLVVTPGLPGRRRPRAAGGPGLRVRRRAEPGARARAHAGARASRDPRSRTAIPFVLAFPLLLRVGLEASGAPLGRAGARRVAARLLAGRAARGRAGRRAAGARAGLAAGGRGARRRRRARLLGRVLRAGARPRASAGCSAVEAELAQERSLAVARGCAQLQSAGHSIPTSGSSKRKPDSARGRSRSSTCRARRRSSESTQKPCAKPSGT